MAINNKSSKRELIKNRLKTKDKKQKKQNEKANAYVNAYVCVTTAVRLCHLSCFVVFHRRREGSFAECKHNSVNLT